MGSKCYSNFLGVKARQSNLDVKAGQYLRKNGTGGGGKVQEYERIGMGQLCGARLGSRVCGGEAWGVEVGCQQQFVSGGPGSGRLDPQVYDGGKTEGATSRTQRAHMRVRAREREDNAVTLGEKMLKL